MSKVVREVLLWRLNVFIPVFTAVFLFFLFVWSKEDSKLFYVLNLNRLYLRRTVPPSLHLFAKRWNVNFLKRCTHTVCHVIRTEQSTQWICISSGNTQPSSQ